MENLTIEREKKSQYQIEMVNTSSRYRFTLYDATYPISISNKYFAEATKTHRKHYNYLLWRQGSDVALNYTEIIYIPTNIYRNGTEEEGSI